MRNELVKYLAIHVGHTRVKIGVFDFDENVSSVCCLQSLTITNEEELPWNEIENACENCTQIVSIITGSNLIKSREIQVNWNNNFQSPLFIERNSSIPVKSLVDVPEKVGPDRLLNAVAVNILKDVHKPAIVVDSGTAITVDAISKEGQFLGGAILPGVLMGARAMNHFTTTLPLINGEKFLEVPPHAIGRNTEDAMASGLYWGHLGAVKELVERVQEELGDNSQLFLTGGAVPILQPYLPNANCEPYLSLIGSVITAQSMLNNMPSQ